MKSSSALTRRSDFDSVKPRVGNVLYWRPSSRKATDRNIPLFRSAAGKKYAIRDYPAQEMTGSKNRRRAQLERITKSGLMVATGLLLAREAYWILLGAFNVDEYENLQILWLMQRRLWPIRDYFHTHLPMYNFILYPVFAWFGPRADLPGIVRVVFLPVVLLTVWQVWWLGRRVGRSSGAAWLTTTLFLASPWVGNSLVEMRPDVFGAAFMLGATMCFVVYAESGGERPFFMYLSGLACGLSFAIVTKTILVMLAIAGLFEVFNFHAARLPSARRWARMTVFGVLTVAPFGFAFVALQMAGLLKSGAMLSVFLFPQNILNTEFLVPYSRRTVELVGLSTLPVFVVGAVDAIGVRFWRWRDIDAQNAPAKLVATIAPLATAQLLLVTWVAPHFFLPLVAFFAMLAARRSWTAVSWAYPIIVVAATLCLGQFNTRDFYKGRSEQVATVQTLMSAVPADKPILDAWTGFGAFHALLGNYLYFRPSVRDDPKNSYVSLVAQTLRRRGFGAVVYDARDPTTAVGIESLIRKNYVASERPTVFFPKEDTP